VCWWAPPFPPPPFCPNLAMYMPAPEGTPRHVHCKLGQEGEGGKSSYVHRTMVLGMLVFLEQFWCELYGGLTGL
jgi:hypothetical protein